MKQNNGQTTPSSGQTVLEIERLSFSIGETQILKNIDLKIKKGEFIGLIGPNGAGKTTLLKCINGMNKGEGKISIRGVDLERLNRRDIAKEIALMHQNTSIDFPFPSIDVVLMGRYPHLQRMRGEAREDYRIARQCMEYTGTLKFENRSVTTLSGGERQKVFFAKVLAQKTNVILLDEPTASLDITHEEQIFKFSSGLCGSGITVIAAVHDLKIAARYCGRLVLMKEGTILADGTPEEVLTSANLSRAYGVNALVYKNRITGRTDFYIQGLAHKKTNHRHVHVIGGGGSASSVIRQLFEEGFKVTAGVFAHGDSDLQCAEIFGIEHLACKPFSEISEETFMANIEYVKKADMTILCNMPFGTLNFRNLEAARYAGNLVMIEDDTAENRDFTGGKAARLYNELKRSAVVTTSARLHEVLSWEESF